jgi:pyrroline-5-carboxylate reductase
LIGVYVIVWTKWIRLKIVRTKVAETQKSFGQTGPKLKNRSNKSCRNSKIIRTKVVRTKMSGLARFHGFQLDADTCHDNSEVVRKCDVVFLAVKPNMFPAVMDDLGPI